MSWGETKGMRGEDVFVARGGTTWRMRPQASYNAHTVAQPIGIAPPTPAEHVYGQDTCPRCEAHGRWRNLKHHIWLREKYGV